MIEKMDPNNLFRCLRNLGPYIYFYNEYNDTGENKEIVDNVISIAIKHYKINVFEIEWKDQLQYNSFTSPQMLNNIYLYSQGMLVKKIESPNKKEIEFLFEKAIVCFNINIEKRIGNIGKKSKKIIVEDKNVPNHSKTKFVRRYKNTDQTRAKSLLKRKIILESQMDTQEEHLNIEHQSQTNKTLNEIGKNMVISKIQDLKNQYKYFNNEYNSSAYSEPKIIESTNTDNDSDLLFNIFNKHKINFISNTKYQNRFLQNSTHPYKNISLGCNDEKKRLKLMQNLFYQNDLVHNTNLPNKSYKSELGILSNFGNIDPQIKNNIGISTNINQIEITKQTQKDLIIRRQKSDLGESAYISKYN